VSIKHPHVAFIGAGPGDPELLTIKAWKTIQQADLVLFAGSLVPREVVSWAGPQARVEDSSSMNLDQTHALLRDTVVQGGLAARIHTGDPSLYGAVREQAILLERDGIDYEIIPGVTAAFAAAARAGVSLTLPEKTQTLILTRMEGRTPVPGAERIRSLAAHGSSLAVYLSAGQTETLVSELQAGGYPADTPAIAAYRVGWPEEQIVRTTVSGLARAVSDNQLSRQVVFLILPGQDSEPAFSKLYDPQFSHGFRSE
jgi:precorrin-4/cobalt-precorrin-4 C11-methyltransferase